jgi:hypothetical protein
MNTPNRNDEAVYRTVDQMMKETNLCRRKVMKLSEEAGAVIRIGRLIRIRADKFFGYVDSKYGRSGES